MSADRDREAEAIADPVELARRCARLEQAIELAAEQLRASEDRLRRVAEVARVGTWVMDLATRAISSDGQFLRFFGLTAPGPHVLSAYLERVVPEDRGRIARAVERALAGEGSGVLLEECRVRGADGEVRWFEGRGKAELDEHGRAVKFLGTAVDITARKEAELEREQLLREAARARARLHAQLMQAPVAVSVVTGPDQVIEIANPRYLELSGRTADAIGKSLRAAFPDLPADAPIFAIAKHVYATGVPFSADEYPFSLGADGQIEERYFQISVQPVIDETGAVHDIMTVAIDVTAQVHERRRNEALMKELQLADQRKDEFLATLAHELRNPMAALSSALGLLEKVEDDPERARAFRETARRQVTHLVRLVDDLLDVARITQGKIELRKTAVDFAAVVRDALAATRSVIEAREHELTTTIAPGAFRIEADATRLEQVVVNLLVNAAKYTERGGQIAVRLRRERSGPGEVAVLSVRDTGRGIPPDMIERVFDLFTQVSPSIDRKTGGLGLGLTLVKRLVELHGGSAAAASEGDGKGSELTIRLPLARARLVQVPAPAPSAPVFHRRRVLVIEDSQDVRELMEAMLLFEGHEVFLAADGVEGVARVLEVRPDVALIDIGLPVMDGYEVARRVRAAPEGMGVQLVAVTGYGGAEVKARARAAGFDGHLTKPIDLRELAAVLATPDR